MGIIDKAVELITRFGTDRKLLSEMQGHMKESSEIRRQLRELITRSLNHSGPEATLQALGIECKTVFGMALFGTGIQQHHRPKEF